MREMVNADKYTRITFPWWKVKEHGEYIAGPASCVFCRREYLRDVDIHHLIQQGECWRLHLTTFPFLLDAQDQLVARVVKDSKWRWLTRWMQLRMYFK